MQDRNDYTPEFDRNTYDADDLIETATPGQEVIQVVAVDNDPEGINTQIRYTITAVSPASGADIFYVWPETGIVTVRRALSTVPNLESRYTVSI